MAPLTRNVHELESLPAGSFVGSEEDTLQPSTELRAEIRAPAKEDALRSKA